LQCGSSIAPIGFSANRDHVSDKVLVCTHLKIEDTDQDATYVMDANGSFIANLHM
jgi:hypothetical protein